jgi:Membrane-bound toxin component of toxin-antitoxin system
LESITGFGKMSGAIVLQFPVMPSLRFAVLLGLLHLLAASVVVATVIALPVKLLMLLLTVLSLAYYLLRDVLLLLPVSWLWISLSQHEVSVVTRKGAGFQGQVAARTVVSPYFVVLRVLPQGCHRPVFRVFFPDSMRPGAFRELCVHLKFA